MRLNEGKRGPFRAWARLVPYPAFPFACALAIVSLSAPLAAQGANSGQAWWMAPQGPAYQILVYSFADSDGDGSGDLRGIIEKLDYLNDGNAGTDDDLGVQAIWLSPIHPAASYHGYDVLDYKAVSARLGSMEDFERLCAECRKRGVKVILDMVFNHSAKGHPWFTAFLDDPDGPFGAYYVRKDESRRYGAGGSGRFYSARGSGGETSYFSAFGEGMPDLNCSNPAVVAEFEGILDFWISRGADGFRFDAAKHVFDPNEMPAGSPTRPMTISFWNGLREYARGKKPDVFFLGEVMSDYLTEIVAYSGCMDSVFDFPTAKQTLAAVSSPSSGASFVSSFEKAYAAYSAVPGFAPAIFLSNHDQDRSMGFFLSRSGLLGATGWGPVPGDADFARAAKSAALARAKLAASLIFTLPGLPFIYYGEELGMIGRRYLNDDVARRDAFPWNDSRSMPPNAAWTSASGKLEAGQNANTPSALSQESDPGSLLSHYRVLSSLRRRLPALSSGTWEKPPWPGFSGSGLVSYVRSGGGQRVLVVHNLAAEARKIPSDGSDALTPLFDSAGGAANSGGGRVDGDPGEIRPMSTRIFSY